MATFISGLSTLGNGGEVAYRFGDADRVYVELVNSDLSVMVIDRQSGDSARLSAGRFESAAEARVRFEDFAAELTGRR